MPVTSAVARDHAYHMGDAVDDCAYGIITNRRGAEREGHGKRFGYPVHSGDVSFVKQMAVYLTNTVSNTGFSSSWIHGSRDYPASMLPNPAKIVGDDLHLRTDAV